MAVVAARRAGAQAMVVYTASGRTARLLSKEDSRIPIVAITNSEEVRRRLTLLRNVVSYCIPASSSVEGMIASGDAVLRAHGLAEATVVEVSGAAAIEGATNTVTDPDAQARSQVMPFGGADLHFHSTFSDGVESPAELVLRAVAAGLSVAALTDHDAVHGVPAFVQAAAGTGLVAAGGAELSVDDGGEDVHLLGLFLDPEEPDLIERLTWFRQVRDQRGEAIVEKLAQLGVTLDLAALRAEVGAGAFGRPHVARALVAKGVVQSVGEAFDRYLGDGGPAFVPKAKWGLCRGDRGGPPGRGPRGPRPPGLVSRSGRAPPEGA